MKTSWINRGHNGDGSQNVTFHDAVEGWIPAGKLQPEVTNHVKEQPTNRWKQALIDAQRAQVGSDH